MRKRIRIILMLGLTAGLLAACTGRTGDTHITIEEPGVVSGDEGDQASDGSGSSEESVTEDEPAASADNEVNTAPKEEEPSELAWIAYWDQDKAMDVLKENTGRYDSIGMFAAYYDQHAEVFIPEETVKFSEELKANGMFEDKTVFLTVVNDQIAEGANKLKDTDLLYELIGTEEDAQAHAQTLIKLATDGGYDGLEIDYEAIRDDARLWDQFISFIKILKTGTQEAGLAFRVLLEPSAPVADFDWPDDIEYVMMCYNLYGYGTEPGPKAEPEFLKEMVTRMERLPGTVNFALANGGFDFAGENVAQLTQAQCEELIAQYNAEPVRDENSSDMVFTYTDEENVAHEVWYADDQTIDAWKQIITEAGHKRFSIWRL